MNRFEWFYVTAIGVISIMAFIKAENVRRQLAADPRLNYLTI